MILKLPYDRTALPADLRGLRCRTLDPAAPRGRPPANVAAEALDAPLEGPPLVELARGRKSVTVLVPDETRQAWLPAVLPELLDRLQRGGVDERSVCVLVACGTHPPADDANLAALLGPLPPGVRVLQHDARDDGALRAAGTLASGLEVRLHRAVLEADLLVVVSACVHHYFAGFGGGPKMVFPGVAGYEETQVNHARVLDLEADPPRRRARCEPGVLEGNPVAEEIAAAAALRPPQVVLMLVGGTDGRPAWASCGPLHPTFSAACERVRRWYEVEAGPFSRLVVASEGFPRDATLIQAHKALDAACRFCAPGAEVLWVAACSRGGGSPAIEPFLADPRPAAIFAHLRDHYVQYGHTVLRLVEKTARLRIALLSNLPEELVRRLGMTPVASAQEVLERWRAEGEGETVGVMAGATVYPCASAGSERLPVRPGE
jgi:nickel-dependent lactate racemase